MLSRTVFIIPVYNHAGSIGAIIEKLHAFQRPVYVIDDGSTDNTAKILDQLNGVNNIRHPSNQGKGRALMTGFAAASLVADWAITLDADGQHDPADALNLLKAVKDCERSIVIGKRTHMLQKGAPWTSRWGRRFSNFWVWTCSGLKLSDTQSGFRLYPLPEALMMNARGKRFQFEVEILVLAAWTGIPVREAEVSTQYRFIGHRVSHFRPVMDFWRNTLTFSRLLVLRLFTSKRFRATGMK
ncbi:MAG: glycosyltransferase family 2 protein [Deltaproteobacteria bacterium]|nr:glycosyltransferase family 2 protein [Deltaproteobacteria bacterium]